MNASNRSFAMVSAIASANPERTLAIAERQLQDQSKWQRRRRQANDLDILPTYYLERRSFW